jgi:hypothetical protein
MRALLPPRQLRIFWRPRGALLAAVLLLRAGGLHAHPEIDEALARLNAAIAASPGSADLYIDRGELYARHDDFIAAEANYLRAGELAPNHPRLLRQRGGLELAAGRPAAALPLLTAALEQAPADHESRVLRARAHAALQQNAAAAADYDAAIAGIAEPIPALFLERAAVLPAPAALASLDQAMARIGPALTLQLRAVALEESLGRIDAAAVRLDAIAAASERKELWLKRRGDLLARAGRTGEAQSAYTAARRAIADLPAWLRESPDTRRLASELARLTDSRS